MDSSSSGSSLDTMEFRPAREGDFADILDVINEAARGAYKGSVVPADEWKEPYMPESELRCDIEDAGIRFTLLASENEVVAVMGVQRRDVPKATGKPNVTLVRHAYVRPAWQRKGCGKALLQHLLESRSAAEEGRPVLVGTWASNHEAISFYSKHGFALIDDPAFKNELLRTYWFAGGDLGASNDGGSEYRQQQMAASVVLADEAWFATSGSDKAASEAPLVMHTFELPQSSEPWTYEESVRAAVCDGGRLRLLRWHISGPGSCDSTVAVEAVTYAPDFMDMRAAGAGPSSNNHQEPRPRTQELEA